MKYINAKDVLPEELLSMIQKYYQGGYLYIPKDNYCVVKQQTDYKIELGKRRANQRTACEYISFVRVQCQKNHFNRKNEVPENERINRTHFVFMGN